MIHRFCLALSVAALSFGAMSCDRRQPADERLPVGKPAEPLIVAHRGASGSAPENTLPAFELGWKLGADAIEADFQLTRDGEIICFHDKDAKRVAGVDRLVKDMTLAELKALDAGAWFGDEWKGTPPPTLAEVLATVPAGKKIYIEIKCGTEVLPKLFSEIKTSGLKKNQIVLICFNTEVVREYKKQAPDRKAFWLSGLEPDDSGRLKPTMSELLSSLRATNADGLGAYASELVDAGFVKGIHDAGFEFHVWTVNEPEVARRFRDLGAGSITTNFPALIREELD